MNNRRKIEGQCLKRLLTWLRAKLHNDLYERIQQQEQRITSFTDKRVQLLEAMLNTPVMDKQQNMTATAEKFITLEAQITELQEWHKASFCNQIALANPSPEPLTLMTPWSEGRKRLALTRLESQALCFAAPPVQNKFKKPVFVLTVPKSGTWLIDKIFRELGLENVKILGGNDSFSDFRPPLPYEVPSDLTASPEQFLLPPDGDLQASIRQFLPYEVYSALIQPGQFLMAHLGDLSKVKWAHQNDKILLSVREPRSSCISFLRFVHRTKDQIPGQQSFTSEQLANFIQHGDQVNMLIAVIKLAISLKDDPRTRIIRFEELTSSDRAHMQPSVNAISEITGLPAEDVCQAVETCRGSNAKTYSGQNSRLDDIWTQEVENAFITKGLDILSEQLGYSRHYSPLA